MISIHIIALFFLTIIRVILLLTNISSIQNIDPCLVYSALIRGVWFDNVIACYITIMPLALLSISGLFNYINKSIIRITNIYYIVFFGSIFALSYADIPHFNYFFKHINASIFNWKEEGGNALSMIVEESSYYIYFVAFLLFLILFIVLTVKQGQKVLKDRLTNLQSKQYYYCIPLCIVLIALAFLGIRGRIGYNPIKTSQAYFSINSFFNQLGLNPTFF